MSNYYDYRIKRVGEHDGEKRFNVQVNDDLNVLSKAKWTDLSTFTRFPACFGIVGDHLASHLDQWPEGNFEVCIRVEE